MSGIDPVGFLPPTLPIVAPALGGIDATQASSAAGGFGAWFAGQLGKVDGQLQVADQQLQALASGEAQNLHQVMLGLEEARLSFQLLMQVRNRALEAYQDVMRMQV
jgi:flagellar hook-basal body complex protein FliE